MSLLGIEVRGSELVPLFDGKGKAAAYEVRGPRPIVVMHPWHLQTLRVRDREFPPDDDFPRDCEPPAESDRLGGGA